MRVRSFTNVRRFIQARKAAILNGLYENEYVTVRSDGTKIFSLEMLVY